MKKIFLVLSFMMVSAILFPACKKDKQMLPEPSVLIGSWSETPATPNFQRTLFFAADGTFTMHFNYFGFMPGAETMSGIYTTSGEKINLRFLKYIHAEPNKEPVTLVNSPQLYDQATYKVKGNLLILNYVSYPADAPVNTTATFLKN